MNTKEKASTTETVASKIDVGQRLKQAREELNLSASDIAQHLRLPSRVIQSIEQDKHTIQEMNAFTRGYVRSYARFVNIPMKEIDQFFSQAGISVKRIKPAPLSTPAEASAYHAKSKKLRKILSHPHRMHWASYFIVGLLILFVGLWLYSRHYFENEVAISSISSVSATNSVANSTPTASIEIPASAETEVSSSSTSTAVNTSSKEEATKEPKIENKPSAKNPKKTNKIEVLNLNPSHNVITREWVEPR